MTGITMRPPSSGDLEQVVKLCNHVAIIVQPEPNLKCEYIEIVKIFCAECGEFHEITILIN